MTRLRRRHGWHGPVGGTSLPSSRGPITWIAAGALLTCICLPVAGCERRATPPRLPGDAVRNIIDGAENATELYEGLVALGLDHPQVLPAVGGPWHQVRERIGNVPYAPPPASRQAVTAADVFWSWILAKQYGKRWTERIESLASTAPPEAVGKALTELVRFNCDLHPRLLWVFLRHAREAEVQGDLWDAFARAFRTRRRDMRRVRDRGPLDGEGAAQNTQTLHRQSVRDILPGASPSSVAELVRREPQHLEAKWRFVQALTSHAPGDAEWQNVEEALRDWLLSKAEQRQDPASKRLAAEIRRSSQGPVWGPDGPSVYGPGPMTRPGRRGK